MIAIAAFISLGRASAATTERSVQRRKRMLLISVKEPAIRKINIAA
jgi:hypothetical protein